MGTVVDIVYDESVSWMKMIFDKFDHSTIGENAKKMSTYSCSVPGAVPIEEMQVNFSVQSKSIMSGKQVAISFNIGLGCNNTQMSRANSG